MNYGAWWIKILILFPPQQLREKLRPQLQGLVNKQRLTILEAGELLPDFNYYDQLSAEFVLCVWFRIGNRYLSCYWVTDLRLTVVLALQLQHLQFLIKSPILSGESFSTVSSNRRRPRTLFCRLSSNHKTLHYGYDIPVEGNICPTIDELPDKRELQMLNLFHWQTFSIFMCFFLCFFALNKKGQVQTIHLNQDMKSTTAAIS